MVWKSPSNLKIFQEESEDQSKSPDFIKGSLQARENIFKNVKLENLIISTACSYLRSLIYQYFHDKNLRRRNVVSLFEKCFSQIPTPENLTKSKVDSMLNNLLTLVANKYRDQFLSYKIYKLAEIYFPHFEIFEYHLDSRNVRNNLIFLTLPEPPEESSCLGFDNIPENCLKIPDDVDLLLVDKLNIDHVSLCLQCVKQQLDSEISVDSLKKSSIYQFLTVFVHEKIYGIDTEFFTSVFERSSGTTSLIQLASLDKILVIDAVELNFDQIAFIMKCLFDKHWSFWGENS